MRLTLRTLLGWIDGVLPPEEHDVIGVMVADSKVATRLADRIRAGAAHGSMDVPLTGGPAIADDPNRVAEYIDNTLLSEHLEAFERLCIESRPHFEELAACHGMLAEMHRAPKLAQMPCEQRSVLSQRIRRSLSTSAVACDVACHERSEDRSESVLQETVPVEKPAAASRGHADARTAADALVQAMLSKPSRPIEPVQSDDRWHDPVATVVSLLPSWPRRADKSARELVASASVASRSAAPALPSKLPSKPVASPPDAASAEPAVGPAAASGKVAGGRPTSVATWVTAALALAVLLAAGGALMSPLRAPKTYAPEPGCMHCTKR